MSSELTQSTIEDLQRKLDAQRNQIKQARDNKDEDLASSLEPGAAGTEKEIASLQSQLNDELKREAAEAAEEAREEQKKEDRFRGFF